MSEFMSLPLKACFSVVIS